MSERSNSQSPNHDHADETSSPATGENAFDHLTLESRLESAGILVDDKAPAPALDLGTSAADVSPPSSMGQGVPQSQRARLAQWQEELPQGQVSGPGFSADRSSEARTSELGTAFAPPARAGRNKLWLLVFLVGAAGLWAFQSRPVKEAADDPVDGPADDTPVANLYEPDLAAPPFAPECWRSDKGFQFRYKDASDSMQTVERITQIPTLYRRNADCVPIAMQENSPTP